VVGLRDGLLVVVLGDGDLILIAKPRLGVSLLERCFVVDRPALLDLSRLSAPVPFIGPHTNRVLPIRRVV
jgi:hypothetical protein